jgi:hypothetical protein
MKQNSGKKSGNEQKISEKEPNSKQEVSFEDIPKTWKCEFCQTENELNLSPEEVLT